MPNFSPNFITLEKLGMAYRKAKVDLYYANNGGLTELLSYEENLSTNLNELLEHLNNDSNDEWFKSETFLGGWTLAPQKIVLENKDNVRSNPIVSAPQLRWDAIFQEYEKRGKKPKAEFRLMATPSIHFHVLSSLWISLVGHKFDEKLRKCVYGSRLRRTRGENGELGQFNQLSLGSFKPYIHPYREWINNGLRTAHKALSNEKKVVIMTGDIASFYHKLSPEFLKDKNFYNKVLEVNLSDDEAKLNKLFIDVLLAWAKETPLKNGLPVGLPASALVANLALVELDNSILSEIVPLYYGRYVDDIILVMENGANFKNLDEVWKWISRRCGGALPFPDGNNLEFKSEYIVNSEIHFEQSKTKAYLLEGKSGYALIDSISRQIQKRASEWRRLPILPSDNNHITSDIICALETDGEDADNIRKTNSLTMKRAAFAMKLRDFEAHERNLNPDDWEVQRHTFLEALIEHMLVLPDFFDLSIYLPRVIKLATACGDFEVLKKIIEKLDKMAVDIEKCHCSIKSAPEKENNEEEQEQSQKNFWIWLKSLKRQIRESLKSSFPRKLSDKDKALWNELTETKLLFHENLIPSTESLSKDYNRFFVHDLAYVPFRCFYLAKKIVAFRNLPDNSDITPYNDAINVTDKSVVVGINKIIECTRIGSKNILPHGLLFSTRPLSLLELCLLFESHTSKNTSNDIADCILALRGYRLKVQCKSNEGIFSIPYKIDSQRIKIALASWRTDDSSWEASLGSSPDLSVKRYQRLHYLINQLLSYSPKPQYLIMPELSIPSRWFTQIAIQLHKVGINFIAGVEYHHYDTKKVTNRVFSALTHSGFGFPALILFVQGKQSPALGEERLLHDYQGLQMLPQQKLMNPPIIKHGDFYFSILICSELTNITYRNSLRGKIDALFVPEWNKDTGGFNALVESAALDIHAYIIQCNNRKYGDSRIRAPYKDDWRRDVVQLKGGTNDFFAIGEIDVQKLRKFQSYHRSPDKPYKPVPDGFEISDNRKVLPGR